jgi:nicotinamidase-related amidase
MPESFLKVGAADGHNLFVVSMKIQQFVTKPEKRAVSYAVVFQNNPFRLMLEKPADRGTDRVFASQVLRPKKS